MKRYAILILLLPVFALVVGSGAVEAGPPIMTSQSALGVPQPRCAIELTCTDGFVKLGYQDGVCFRATCPGVWALIHRRTDESSFRRRFLSYRHYRFKGYWQLVDQGILESGPVDLRELFMVLPEDLIEFRMAVPDCHAKVEVRNLGYIKKGTINELKAWLACQTHMANLSPDKGVGANCPSSKTNTVGCLSQWLRWGGQKIPFSGFFSNMGLPLLP